MNVSPSPTLGGQQTGWTASRAEFIGRNGSLDAPLGLLSRKGLKGRVGAGLRPLRRAEDVDNP